ncbi:MAG: hypothetical protein E7271_06845 [Lachnospiraceae bacterium]|nr:hypothetical protein [Lachnospiraceae bacterium]
MILKKKLGPFLILCLLTGCVAKPNIAISDNLEGVSTEKATEQQTTEDISESSEQAVDSESVISEEDCKKYADAVIGGEDIWLNELKEMMKESGDVAGCWFQDFNMDGIPEFIVGPHTIGVHAAQCYKVYSVATGVLKPLMIREYESEDNSLQFWKHAAIFNSEELDFPNFQGYLYMNDAGEYNFYIGSTDGTGSGQYYAIDELVPNGDSFTRESRIAISYGYLDYDQSELGWTATISFRGQDAITTDSVEDVRNALNKLFEGKERKCVNVSSYIVCEYDDNGTNPYLDLSYDKKLELLKSSIMECYENASISTPEQKIPFEYLLDEIPNWETSTNTGQNESDDSYSFSLDEYVTEYLFMSPGVHDTYWELYDFDGEGHYNKDAYSVDGEYLGSGGEGTYTCTGSYLIIDNVMEFKIIHSTGSLFMDGEEWDSRGILVPLVEPDVMNADEYQELVDDFIYDKDGWLDGSDYRN